MRQSWIPALLLAGYLLFLGAEVFRRTPTGSDFSAYYIAALRLQAGQGLYDQTNPDNLYVYPPLFVLLVFPLSFLPLAWAGLIWYLAGLALLAWIFRLLPAALPSPRVDPATIRMASLLAFLFCARPIINHLLRGQANLLVLALVLWAMAETHRDRNGRSSAALALAVILKPFALLALPLFAWWRGWRWLAGWFVGILFFSLLPALHFGLAANASLWGEWARRYALPASGAGSQALPLSHPPFDFLNQSLYAVVLRLISRVDAVPTASGYLSVHWLDLPLETARILAGIAPILLLLIAWCGLFRTRPFSAESSSQQGALALLLMVLIPPFTWKANFVLLLPSAYLLALEATEGWRTSRRIGRAGACLAASFAIGSLSALLPVRSGEIVQACGAVMWGAMILAWALFRSARSTR